ncbi:MAG: hypothetical protein HND48_07630 [Chloroflexi bacterium]|nr:hypothetical protein [Chloroflexota bacterium]
MAKKRKSTPLPKAPAAKEAKQLIEPTRIDRLLGRNPNQEQTRHEREAAVQRLIVMSVVAAAVVIGILLVIAFVVDGIVRPSQNVATVSGESISVGDYQQRVRIERALQIELINDALNDIVEENGVTVDEAGNFVLQQQPYATYWSELNTSDVMGLRVLDDMVDDKLIAAAAAEPGCDCHRRGRAGVHRRPHRVRSRSRRADRHGSNGDAGADHHTDSVCFADADDRTDRDHCAYGNADDRRRYADPDGHGNGHAGSDRSCADAQR